ncbi:MAG: hypothetical protein RMJ84_09950 [Sandaracinaceae bacterium]|nr:hypothetical protein [Sandaracinaceae bacterium]
MSVRLLVVGPSRWFCFLGFLPLLLLTQSCDCGGGEEVPDAFFPSDVRTVDAPSSDLGQDVGVDAMVADAPGGGDAGTMDAPREPSGDAATSDAQGEDVFHLDASPGTADASGAGREDARPQDAQYAPQDGAVDALVDANNDASPPSDP